MSNDLLKTCYGYGLTLEEWKEKFKEEKFLEIKDVDLKLFHSNYNGDTTVENGIETLIVMPHTNWSPAYGRGWSGSSGSASGVEQGERGIDREVTREEAEKLIAKYPEFSYNEKNHSVQYRVSGKSEKMSSLISEMIDLERTARKRHCDFRVNKIELNGMLFSYEVQTTSDGDCYTSEGSRAFYIFRNNLCCKYYWVAGIWG